MATAIIFGSSNGDGNTRQLVNTISNNLSAKIFDLNDFNFSFYDYAHHNKNDDFLPLIHSILQANHLIFATPMYWYSMSAQMKVFFDRLSDLISIEKEIGRLLKGKKVSLITTGCDPIPPSCFSEPVRLTAQHLGMHYHSFLYCTCPQDFSVIEHRPQINQFLNTL